MLNNKWMQKKESGNVLSKQELNERSTWTSEQFMIADFQDQLEHNREAEKRQKIDNKIMSGGSLSPEEISYLEKNDPVALKKYRETKEEKESYKEKLRQCKTKEEVDRVKLQKLGELESSLSSIVNDPAIPKSAKLAKAQEILAKTNNIEAAHLEFVKSADYQSMPTDEEKKEQDAADNDISDEITDSEKADDTELTDASDNIPDKADTVDTKVSDKTSEKDNHKKEYSTEIKKVSRKLKKGFEAADMHVDTIVHNEMRDTDGDVNDLSDGLNSIYILSLLETYAEYGSTVPYIILIEDPEIYLHPQLQKIASEILYKLSRKNQVIFCTHSPQMLFNFTTRQIRQVINDRDNNTVATPEADIDDILDDLGYAANDLMNVSFVFIVEGKQDRSRLPLLLEKYYSEVIDENGNLNRIAIIATNSCTNIKTYANLKYINTLYLKDEFLMIRDGDGKDADRLRDQLTNYYKQRAKQDYGNLPRVTDRNVLILKYYSFENYFLDPEIMTKIGVVKSVDQFYDILYAKYKEYLYRLVSTKNMLEKLNITIETKQDIIDNMENIRKYVRGHNLYDIFYGRYKGEKENAILRAYIDAAPMENFEDIFTAIDNFVYFNNRRNE